MYIGTAEYGVYKSIDGGERWEASNEGLPMLSDRPDYPEVRAMAIDSLHGILYAGLVPFGLFKSLNGGESWVPVNYGSAVTGLSVDRGDSNCLYVIGPHGVFRSVDGGDHWSDANRGIVNSHTVALAMDPSVEGTVYAGTVSYSFMRDDDRGDGRWRPVNPSGRGVFKSINRGHTWELAGLPDANVSAVAVDPGKTDTVYAATWGGELHRSGDGGRTWGLLNWSYYDVEAIVVDARDSTIFIGTTGFGIYRSVDGGSSWTGLNNGVLGRGKYANSIAIDGSKPSTMYVGSAAGGVFKTTDGGGSWREISEGLRDKSGPYVYPLQVSTVVIDPHTPTTLYAGTYYGGLSTDSPPVKTTGGVYKSVDSGETWSPAYDGLDDGQSLYVNHLIIDPRRSATLYAGTDAGVFISTDAGGHWVSMNDGLVDLPVARVAIDPRGPGSIYAATLGGGTFVLSPAPVQDGDAKRVAEIGHSVYEPRPQRVERNF
jgi:photosystem II stability/assembly factor-like uncharacterized protein